MQEQVSFALIQQCYDNLWRCLGKNKSAREKKISELKKFDIESYCSMADTYLDFSERESPQFITKIAAKKFYDQAQNLAQEFRKVSLLSKQAEQSLAELRKVVLLTPDEAKSLTTSSSFFKSRQDNRNLTKVIPAVLLSIPVSVGLTYIASLAYDASSGATSIDSVNKFFGSKLRDASFADGLKTPGVIYGLATLLALVVCVSIYRHSRNRSLVETNVPHSPLPTELEVNKPLIRKNQVLLTYNKETKKANIYLEVAEEKSSRIYKFYITDRQQLGKGSSVRNIDDIVKSLEGQNRSKDISAVSVKYKVYSLDLADAKILRDLLENPKDKNIRGEYNSGKALKLNELTWAKGQLSEIDIEVDENEFDTSHYCIQSIAKNI